MLPTLFEIALIAVTCVIKTAVAQSPLSVVSIPYELTYLLPAGFNGNLEYTFENGTKTSNQSINDLLASASKVPFVAYDPAFLDIIGPNPQLELIEARPGTQFAFEAGVWIPPLNEVWFTSSSSTAPTHVSILNLANNTITPLRTNPPIINFNGGYYFNNTVTFANFRDNTTFRGGIFNVDPVTHEVTTVLDSYFGLQFSGLDDPVWVQRGNKSYLFFDDLNFVNISTPYTFKNNAPFPRGIWRFDPQEQFLSYVISRTDIPVPNGIRVSPDQKTLYITDFGTTQFVTEAGNAETAAPVIYKYDLDEDVMPINRRVFGIVRDGAADGLHVDDAGRFWTGEGSGITVRAPSGKVLGSFNSQALLADKQGDAMALANLALAGDTLIILAIDRLYRVKLAQQVVGPGSLVVD